MAAPIGNVFVTDSIEQRIEGWPRLHVVSIALPLADAIRRLASGEFPPRVGRSPGRSLALRVQRLSIEPKGEVLAARPVRSNIP